MKHMTEEELVAYREGVAEQGALISKHLAACEECRTELERIEAVLAALDTLPVPDPGVDYGHRMWREIAPRLAEKPGRWWHVWTEPRRLAAAGLKHLGHSESMLVELSNAAPNDPAQKEVNIATEQRRAEDLLQENRLYRQTALQEGDTGLASVLDELERVLLDVAHSPEQVTPAQLEAIQKKIEGRGILFKVRVVNKQLQQRQEATKPAPAQNDATRRERNKA